jgi:hypothetical protein
MSSNVASWICSRVPAPAADTKVSIASSTATMSPQALMNAWKSASCCRR